MRAWSTVKAAQARLWSDEARHGHASVDVAFRLADRDKRVAAGVLAGGVAYRFFFWLISCFVLLTGGLGFGDGHRVEEVVTSSGLDPSVAQVVVDSWDASQGFHWWLLLVGGWLVLWTGYLIVKALVLVHAVVWAVPPPPMKTPLRASLSFTGLALTFVVAMVGAQRLRATSPVAGLLVTLAVVLVPLGFWMAVSRRLPHAGISWKDLLPGAVLFAVGVQGLHLFTVFYLSPKLNHATELYGLLGIVGTILFWLYITGRLVVGAATLNASLWEQRSGATHDAPDETGPE